MTTSFKDNSNYSQTIDYVYPDDKISLSNIKNFFAENGLVANEKFMSAMEENYGSALNKETLKNGDLVTKFDDDKIKDSIESSYSTDATTTNVEKIYNSIKKINSTITQDDITNYISEKKLSSITSFADYTLTLLKNG